MSVPTMAVGSRMLISNIYHPIFKLMIDRLGWVIWDFSGKILFGELTCKLFVVALINFFDYERWSQMKILFTNPYIKS